jgi:hypothetical protein
VPKNKFSRFFYLCLAGCAVFMNCDNGSGPGQPVKPLEIVAPKGGESYKVGQTVTVKWKVNDLINISTVGVRLSIDNGKSYKELAEHSLTPDTTFFTWIPDSASSQCVIKVYSYTDDLVFDKSGVFTVTAQ